MRQRGHPRSGYSCYAASTVSHLPARDSRIDSPGVRVCVVSDIFLYLFQGILRMTLGNLLESRSHRDLLPVRVLA